MTRSGFSEIVISILVIPGLLATALGQDKAKSINSPNRDIFWGRRVISKTLEHKRDFGGGFQFRSVAYNMDCSSTKCFENPFHVGEFWFKKTRLTRGINDYDVSVSPSKRFAFYVDPEAKRLELFDRTSGKIDDVAEGGPSEEWKFAWNEPAGEVTAQHGSRTSKIHLPK